jgi:hypothetical protein
VILRAGALVGYAHRSSCTTGVAAEVKPSRMIAGMNRAAVKWKSFNLHVEELQSARAQSRPKSGFSGLED